MADRKKEIVFFIRAYNDIDIQLPLIREYARDKCYQVKVVFYYADGFITDHHAHEAHDYINKEYGVSFQSILQNKRAPLWLRLCYQVQHKIRKMRKRKGVNPIAILLKCGDIALSKMMRKELLNKAQWLDRVSENWKPDIIITDEIQFQPARSPIIDVVVKSLKNNGAATYAILTGHRVYKDIYPAGEPKQKPTTQDRCARIYFVPSQHNQKIYSHLFPNENIATAGNLRMDQGWIETLHTEIMEKAILPRRKVNIVMMLSKMNYGVEADAIKQTIKHLGSMPDIGLAIKPHTRGMKFDFMTLEEIGHAHIVQEIPSTALIDWADIVLMTGSSIAFHAIIKGKTVGFLKYCQKLETIFDDKQACMTFDSLDVLNQQIEQYKNNKKFKINEKIEKDYQNFITHEIYGDQVSGNVAAYYKSLINEDYAKFLATR